MIQDTKDLRYGNILWHDLFKKRVTVRTLSIGTINGLSLKYINPIPLTPMVMAELGFNFQNILKKVYYKNALQLIPNIDKSLFGN